MLPLQEALANPCRAGKATRRLGSGRDSTMSVAAYPIRLGASRVRRSAVRVRASVDRRAAGSCHGQTTIEYVLVMALIVVPMAYGFKAMTGLLRGAYSNIVFRMAAIGP